MPLITASKALERFGDGKVAFVDTRSTDAFRKETIAGAVCLNVYDYFIPESTEESIKGMVAGAREAFAKLGIDRAGTVIFFEERTGMVSPRGLWFHELCGYEGGLILDGGWQAWLSTGGPTAPGQREPATITQGDPSRSGDFRRDLVASTQDVLDRAGGAHILDARRPAEWEGGYVHACCARAGRIMDADLLFFEDLLDDGRYRSPQEMREIAVRAGFSTSEPVIAYCHRGARAATVMYGLKAAGFDKVSVYTGSWHEWAADRALPAVEGTGEYVHR